MGRLFEPPHPGATLREDILPALGLTATEAARQLGVTRTALSRVFNGHASISPAMARRVDFWLHGSPVRAAGAVIRREAGGASMNLDRWR